MSAWSKYGLHLTLLRALYDKSFYEPFDIQKLVLDEAIKTKSNIIGAAQTVKSTFKIKIKRILTLN
jgi:superfamily II DNA/RNA helicase